MNSYYQSLIQQIQSLMDAKDYQQALTLISSELAMPYVPSEPLDILQAFKEECLVYTKPATGLPELETLIHGNASMQECAVNQMKELNLRNHLEEVQVLLNSDQLENEIKGELIESCMEQKTNVPITMKRDGCKYTFIPSEIIPWQVDGIYRETLEHFENWFSNDNPTFYRFCARLLEQERLEMRPLDFLEMDSLSIAKSIVKLVNEAFGQSEMFEVFEAQNGLENVMCTPLLIERRGETDEN